MLKTVLLRGGRFPNWSLVPLRELYRMAAFAAEVFRQLKAVWFVAPLVQSLSATFGHSVSIERVPYIWGKGILHIGDNTRISGRISILFATREGLTPTLTIGKQVFIGHNSAFIMAKSITIGAQSLIGGGVRIQDNDGHPLNADARRRGEKVQETNIQPVVIGENVWIGAQSTILKGVTIGDNAVVGTGSVVTRDVAANTVVAGVPARVIRELGA